MNFRGRGRGGLSHRPTKTTRELCRSFTNTGACNHGAACAFLHALQKQAEIPKAHGNACINDVCIVADLVYTAGADDSIRGWRPTPTANGFSLSPEIVVDCPGKVTSLCFCAEGGGLLACGIAGGLIRIFNKATGAVIDLTGHTGDVFGLLIHSGVLVSAGWDATVRFWSGEGFANCAVVALPGNIKCIQLIGGMLWVGGVHGVSAISLATLQIATEFKFPSPVMGLKAVGPNHLLCASLDGSLRVIDTLTGQETFSSSLASIEGDATHPNIISMEVIISASGKMHAILGQRAGWAKMIDLPEMTFHGRFTPLAKSADVRTIVNAGAGGLFLIGGSDGTLTLWKSL